MHHYNKLFHVSMSKRVTRTMINLIEKSQISTFCFHVVLGSIDLHLAVQYSNSIFTG